MYYINKLIQNLQTGSRLPDDIKEDIDNKDVENLKKKFPFSKNKDKLINLLIGDDPPRKPLKDITEKRKKRRRKERTLKKEKEFVESYYNKNLIIRTKNPNDPVITKVKYVEGIYYFMNIMPEKIEKTIKEKKEWIEFNLPKIESNILRIILEYYKHIFDSRIKYENLMELKNELFKKEEKEKGISEMMRMVLDNMAKFVINRLKLKTNETNFFWDDYTNDLKLKKDSIKTLHLDTGIQKFITQKFGKYSDTFNYYKKLKNNIFRVLEYNELKYILSELRNRTDKYIIVKGTFFVFDIERILSIDDTKFDRNDFLKYLKILKHVDTRIPEGKRLNETINKIKKVFENTKRLIFRIPLQYQHFENEIDKFLITNNSDLLHQLSFSLEENRIKVEPFVGDLKNKIGRWQMKYLNKYFDDMFELIGDNENYGCQYLEAERLLDLICAYYVKEGGWVLEKQFFEILGLKDPNNPNNIPDKEKYKVYQYLKNRGCRV